MAADTSSFLIVERTLRSVSGSKENDWSPKEGGPGNEIMMRE